MAKPIVVNPDNNPLELYDNVPGWREATVDIVSVINGARNKYSNGDLDEIASFNEVIAVLRKYMDWGALDSEPVYHAVKWFCKGTDLDGEDLYYRAG